MRVISTLYAAIVRLRRRRMLGAPERRRRLARPVISVGNLAVGGSGKTPVAALVARLLAGMGERPAILSRGYARTDPEPGVTVVSDGVRLCADLARAGDEPLMLARALPGTAVLVCPDRFLAGRLAERHLGATVHVLDDGFQHVALLRDVDLLLVDAADLASPRTLPAGRLREPLDAARHADAILVEGADGPIALPAAAGVPDGIPCFALLRDFEPPVEETPGGPRPLPAGTPVLAACGIARPERFFDRLVRDGITVADRAAFRDHHPYTRADLERLAARARVAGVDVLLTTDKDLVRLLPLRPWPLRVAVRPMTARVEPAGEFAAWLADRVRRAHARREAVA